MNEKLTVLLVEPNRYPKVVEIDDTLEAMQKVVGGYIEEYMPFEDDVAIICNEEGKIMGLPPNRAIYSEDNKDLIEVISGTFFIAHAPADAENFKSLPKDLQEKYKSKFKYPERFMMSDRGIIAIPFKPVSKDRER